MFYKFISLSEKVMILCIDSLLLKRQIYDTKWANLEDLHFAID